MDQGFWIILLTDCGLSFLEDNFVDPDLTINNWGSVNWESEDFPTPIHLSH